MSRENIALKDLKIGMYVELHGSWLSHDFISSKFLIRSNKELQKIKKMKLDYVTVDFDKSRIAIEEKPVADPLLQDAPKHWDPEKLMTDELKQILNDGTLTPDQKATYIYHHSIDMMKHLLDFPTAENIALCKETIYHISETVLTENDTAMNLLRITSHDYSTYTHSVDVGILSIILSKQLFQYSDGHDLHELAAGFFLHDLGKVDIDYNILNKPGKLTASERELIQSHPARGYQLLKDARALSEECKIVVMQHHEAIDGSGYPNQLKGDEIHPYGKICAIVDVYTALTAERAYKHALSTFQALKLMKEQMSNRFDKDLFNSFIKIFNTA